MEVSIGFLARNIGQHFAPLQQYPTHLYGPDLVFAGSIFVKRIELFVKNRSAELGFVDENLVFEPLL